MSMTYSEVWECLCTKNNKLKNDESDVVFKAKNLKKLLRQVYDQGKDAGKSFPENPFDFLKTRICP